MERITKSISEVQRLKREGWRWRLAPGAATLLDAASLPDGEVLPDDAEILRKSPGRTVYRTRLPNGRSVVIKVYRDVTTADRARRIVSSRGATEWEMLGRAADRGVPVPRRLALGERRRCSVLVLEDLVHHESLAVALARIEAWPPARRLRLVEGIAELVLRMHRGGLLHRDLHPGNIMVPRAGSEAFGHEPYILDLHHARLRPRLSLAERYQDLTDLDLYFAWHGRRSDRVRCARRYLATLLAEQLPRDPEAARRQVDRTLRRLGQVTLERSRQFWLARDARARGRNRYFQSIDLGADGRGILRTEDQSLRPLVIEADRYLSNATTKILKDGTSTTSGIVVTANSTAEPDEIALLPPRADWVFLKRYNRTGIVESVKTFLRGARAARAFHSGWSLEVRGVPSPRVIAYLERTDGKSVLVTDAILGSRNLADLLLDAEVTTDEAWCRVTFTRLARVLKHMHLAGVSHRDLKTTNVLIGAEQTISIVDLDGIVVHPGVVPLALRARDIARLFSDAQERGGLRSPAQREEFLDLYLLHELEERPRSAKLRARIDRELARRREAKTSAASGAGRRAP